MSGMYGKLVISIHRVGARFAGGTVQGKRGTFLIAGTYGEVIAEGFKNRYQARKWAKENL